MHASSIMILNQRQNNDKNRRLVMFKVV